jgi:uncharacterized protein YjeT (DUF2065 family)
MEWRDLGAALALVLVLEGLTPFLSPARFRQAMSQATQLPDGVLRGLGLAALLGGAALLWFIRG